MSKPRYNRETQQEEDYLTLKESFRDKSGLVHTRTLLTVGFLPSSVRAEDVRDIAKALTCRYDNRKYDRDWLPSLRSIYGVAPALYALKDKLERHLCAVTDDLFNQRNRIVLFDLTNFYFEGRKAGSSKAKFGRSKEKRDDCRLLVLALCINSDAHLFLGLLSYWIVNTIRQQLKRKGENCYWTEIVRRMSTQKLITITAVNPFDEVVETRICSLPTRDAADIYDKLSYRHYPFRKMKICTTQT